MTIKERLIQFLAYKKLSQGKFEAIVGLSNGFVNNIGDSIRIKSQDKISKAYPELNILWLQTGIGDMIVPSDSKIFIQAVKEKSDGMRTPDTETRGVPYYDSIVSLQNNPDNPAYYINYMPLNDCTAYIPVVGDSMLPLYSPGESIAIKKITDIEVLLWGEAYFVITTENANSLCTIKLVHCHDDNQKIILRASNPDFKGDTVVNKSDIDSLYIIKGKIKRHQL